MGRRGKHIGRMFTEPPGRDLVRPVDPYLFLGDGDRDRVAVIVDHVIGDEPGRLGIVTRQASQHREVAVTLPLGELDLSLIHI